MKFDYDRDFSQIDFRAHPEQYQVGVGEQGVLLVQPYKGEILPHWHFRTPDIARESAEKIYALYAEYKAAEDFVGMDMARKFLQMGVTRSMRYYNHAGGKKYRGPVPQEHKGESGAWGREELPPDHRDTAKYESARIFRAALDRVKHDPDYIAGVQAHKAKYETTAV